VRRGRAGFTLIEILIAITILVIGVVGIIALFPSTIESASRVVEDTYSATIVQSVVNSLAAAQRDGRIYPTVKLSPTPTTPYLRYMVFDHDGCLDSIPGPVNPATAPDDVWYSANWQNDHVLLMPRGTSTQPTASEPILLYPCPSTSNRNPSVFTPTGKLTSSDVTANAAAFDGSLVVPVTRVFPLGRYSAANAQPGFNAGDIRGEYLMKDPSGNPIAGTLAQDPYPQYSFALAIRRTATDTNNDKTISALDTYTDDLFEVRIMVYRNFDPNAASTVPVPKSNVPVREFVTFIELGPGITTTGQKVVQINNNPLNK
jgi:prepilin-type N-terminal cleavage/methylation domain-containing protein